MNDVEKDGTVEEEARFHAGRYLTFHIDSEEFGFEITRVREIIGCPEITPVPRAPVAVRGVLNRRGEIIPVIDLRVRLGMATVTDTRETCVIIVTTEGTPTGVVVDRVCEVREILSDEFVPPNTLISNVNDRFLLGFTSTEDGIKLLLDVDAVVSGLEDFADSGVEVEEVSLQSA